MRRSSAPGGAVTAVDPRAEPTHTWDWAVLVVAVAGTAAFRNEDRLSNVLKLVAASAVILAAIRGMSHLPGRDRQMVGISLATSFFLGLTLVVSMANGVPAGSWATDVAAPAAIALSVPASVAVASRCSRRALELSLAVCGLVAAVSYTAYWLATRRLIDAGVIAGLASWYIPLGAAVYFWTKSASSRVLHYRLLYPAAVLALLVISGSRLALLPVLLLLAWPILRRFVIGPRSRSDGKRIVLGSVLIIAIGTLLLRFVAGVNNLGVSRFLSALDFFGDGRAEDLSYQERAAQAEVAYDVFRANPLVGRGPGSTFTWTSPIDGTTSSTIAESPTGVLADFGLVGALLLFGTLLAVAARSIRRLRRTDVGSLDPADESIVVVVAAAICNSVVASPFDDKGLAIVLILLLSMSLASTVGSPQAARPPTRRPSASQPHGPDGRVHAPSGRQPGWAARAPGSVRPP